MLTTGYESTVHPLRLLLLVILRCTLVIRDEEPSFSIVWILERFDDGRGREIHKAFTIKPVGKTKPVSDTSVTLLNVEVHFLPGS